MTFSIRARSMRTRLLLSACFVALPTVAHAQNTTIGAGTTRTTNLNMDADDTLTVASGGTIQVSGNRAVTINGASTGTGIVITNNGTIEGVPNGTTNGRAISGTGDTATPPAAWLRTITINNTGLIRGGNDAIQITATAADTGVVTINNSGTIISTGTTNTTGVGQAAQGVEMTIPGATLILNNSAGGSITGNEGVLSSGATTIVNAGNITGTGAVVVTNLGTGATSATQGEGVRANSTLTLTNEATGVISGVYGIIGTGNTTIVNRGTITGGDGGLTTSTLTREAIRINLSATSTINNVTLAAGSVTTAGTGLNASGVAVTFGGAAANVAPGTVNTVTVETGAIINGTITAASSTNATDILNLTGSGSQVLVSASNFDTLNVQGGTWGITNGQTLRNGATISTGATLRYDDSGSSGGSVAGTIVNNGTLIQNRTSTVANTGTITGTGGVQIVNTGQFTLFGQNSYSGDTVVSNGRLRSGMTDNSFSANSALIVTGAGVVDMTDSTTTVIDGASVSTPIARNQTVSNLSGDGSVRTSGGTSGGAILTTGSGGGNTEFSGVISGLGGLTKVGTGTLTLSGANTATGQLTVSGGTVALTRWSGATSVINGATLTGAARIYGVLTVGNGTLAPGSNGIGTLNVDGLVLSADTVLNYDLAAPGTGDRIQVNGDLTLDGTLNIADVGGFGEGVYRLVNYTGALTDNGLLIGGVPAGANGSLMTIQTSVATQVNLVYGTPAATTIQFWDGTDNSGDGVAQGGSGSWTNAFPNWTDAAATNNSGWAGAFGVFGGAAGTVTVDDAILFSGAQFMTDGYEIAAGTGTLTTNTALTNIRVDPGLTATISAAITGSGGILKNDAGTLILSGANSYAGATNIQVGTVVALNGGALPATSNVSVASGAALDIRADQTIGGLNGAGNVLLGATLTTGGLNANDSFTGAASGNGGLTKTGTGTLTLGGANSYLGATQVSSGTLQLDGSVAGAVNVASGATLSGSGSAAGVVTIADGAHLAAGGAGAGTFTAGGLVLSSGSVLDMGLGAPNVAGVSDRIQVNGDLTLDGTLNVIDLGGFGVGVYRLIDYTGTLTNNGLDIGTLPAGSNAPHINLQTSVGQQVNLVYDNIVPEIQFWDGAGTTANGAIGGGSGSWNTSGTNWTDANGTANDSWGGRFAVFQGAAGTVTVDGAISVTGMQFMTSGYVLAAGTGALSLADAQTNIRVDPGVSATISAVIGGTGGINKLDSGTLILGGANSYAGATTIAGGTLRAGVGGALPTGTTVTIAAGATLDLTASQTIASLAGAGSVTLSGGSLTTGGGNTDTSYAGIISGSGGLTKAGAGVFTLVGANSYTGATTVSAGTLRLNGGTIGSGALSVAAGATFDVNGGTASVSGLSGAGRILLGSGSLTANTSATSSFTGVISGTGSFAKAGTGNLTLGAANTYSGGTVVTGGTLTAGIANAFGTGTLTVTAPGTVNLANFATTVGGLAGDGNIALGTAILTVNSTGSTAYSGILSGTGRLIKSGTGTLTLNGANTYTGSTTINDGLLVVNGSLAGTLTIGATGRLGGSGRIGSLSVSGIVAPGNSIGTLNVAGSLTFAAGSTYQVEVSPTGISDQIIATGAVTINGGTVSVLTGGQTNFSPLTTYTILTGSAVTGSFGSVVTDLAFLNPSLVYNATTVQLRLLRNDVSLGSVAQTPNQIAVAAAVGATSSGGVFDAVIGLNAADARGAFDQLSGEVFTAAMTVASRDGHDAGRELIGRIDGPRDQKRAFWIAGDMGQLKAGAQDGLAGFDSDRQVLSGGIEMTGDNLRWGVSYRYAKNKISLDAGLGDAKLVSNSAFAYLGYNLGDLRFAGGFGYSANTVSTDRHVAFGSLSNQLVSAGDGHSYTAFGELAYFAKLGGGVRVGPYVGGSINSATFDQAQEWGGAAALVAGKARTTTSLASYGLRGTALINGVTLTGDIGGRTYLDSPESVRMFRFLDTGTGFTANGVQFGKTVVAGRLDASTNVGRLVLGLGLRGETGEGGSSVSARASAGFRF
ncbi:autotransporter-associated beta strand repeat-containing protein [Sphingomonas sp. R-74633]|uniref:autotransporter-associated beta strand repeat-containing protein n=1 Tax=Sphingomonas sp. R-74633 TaxID=2751188 RepID=UPI0015D18B83|nr:autotransporter-associated beta strand repeat-containing protein [Sphingomonas sp. R-74633]NYT41091.1 autotransporter-associated beta strand repeat-containing protein [Sphingomonas sp. R-74633]